MLGRKEKVTMSQKSQFCPKCCSECAWGGVVKLTSGEGVNPVHTDVVEVAPYSCVTGRVASLVKTAGQLRLRIGGVLFAPLNNPAGLKVEERFA